MALFDTFSNCKTLNVLGFKVSHLIVRLFESDVKD